LEALLPNDRLCVCIDANVLLSAIAFGGKPAEILDALFSGRFDHVTCSAVIEETRTLTILQKKNKSIETNLCRIDHNAIERRSRQPEI
jgi:predicted nucleic acid-binding protein